MAIEDITATTVAGAAAVQEGVDRMTQFARRVGGASDRLANLAKAHPVAAVGVATVVVGAALYGGYKFVRSRTKD